MSRKNRDRTTGLPLPDPVVPATTICITIPVPNALEYRSALKGVLSELGKSWTWSQTVGEDNQDAYTAAELWRAAIAGAIYQLDCEDLMSCADVANCIETDAGVQAAIAAIVPAVPIDGSTYPPTVPLTPSQMTARLNEIDDCGFDAFWAQSEQFVDYMVDLGQDVLDQIAAYSAALDAGENVPMGQFLGKLKNMSTAGKVIDFLQWALVTVKAAYEGADNAANRNALKCAIFCEGKDDCLISIQRTLDVLNERNGGLLSPSDLTDLPSLVNAFLTAGFNPALALDLWILFLMGTAKTAGMFGLQGIDETLNLVLAIAVNDANNDWETLCEDCGEPVIEDCYPFSSSQHSFIPYFNGFVEYATYSGGNGFGVGYNPGIIKIRRPDMGGTVVKVIVRFSENVPAGINNVVAIANYDGTGAVAQNDIETDEVIFETVSLSSGLDVDITFDGTLPSTFYITEVCVELAA